MLKYGIPVAVSVGLAYFLYTNVDIDAITTSLRQDVNYRWFLPVIVVSVMSHVFRGLRWRIQLRAVNVNAPLSAVVNSIFGTYFVNLLFPRLGEVWRCGYIANREKAPFSLVLGSMVGDRLSDTLTVLLLTVFTFFLAGDKLALFFDGKEPITLEAIEEMLFNGKEENVFTLYDQLLTGTLEKATEIAKNLMMSSDGAPIQLLGGLIWQLRRLLGVRSMMDQGVSSYEACVKNGVTTKRGQANHTAGAQRYTTAELEKIMATCARYDELFRSVRTEMQETLFPLFLYEVMVKKGEK